MVVTTENAQRHLMALVSGVCGVKKGGNFKDFFLLRKEPVEEYENDSHSKKFPFCPLVLVYVSDICK